MVIPALDWLAERAINAMPVLDLVPGLDAKNGKRLFQGMKDEVQAYIDAPVWEAIKRADEVLGDALPTRCNTPKMQAGNLYTDEAKIFLRRRVRLRVRSQP
jgi:hypothetical protein